MPQAVTLDPTGLDRVRQSNLHRLGHRGSRVVYLAECQTVVDEPTKLTLFPIDEVFKDTTSVLLGFGAPNVYTAIYRDSSDPLGPGWSKFAAFMFWRKPAHIANTKGRVQAGVIFELRNLPIDARNAIRTAMENCSGKRGPSCARMNAQMFASAGFALGNSRSLASATRPTKLASLIWRHGLLYAGVPVNIRIVLTGNKGVSEHFEGAGGVWGKEVTSAQRAFKKAYNPKQTTHQLAPTFEPRDAIGIDPALWSGKPTTIGINRPSWIGVTLAFLFGQQPVYTLALEHIDNVQPLQLPLQPFPGKLDRVTKVKKYVLFSRPVIGVIRKLRTKSIDYYSDIPAAAGVEMLKKSASADHDSALLYNCVVTLTTNGNAEARITALKNLDPRSQQSKVIKTINWILAKHVLVSGYDPKTVFACELWTYVDQNGRTVVCLNNNSGTYKPGAERLQAIAVYLHELFGVQVEIVL